MISLPVRQSTLHGNPSQHGSCTNMTSFIDAGELGWSLYLSAHIRWLREKSRPAAFECNVFTYPDRHALFGSCHIHNHPHQFYMKFGALPQEGFTFRGAKGDAMLAFYEPRHPASKRACNFVHPSEVKDAVFNRHEHLFQPYVPTWGQVDKNYVLVMARRRTDEAFAWRNLPEHYWHSLICVLCERYRNLVVVSVGTHCGAYCINHVGYANYVNLVGTPTTIDDLLGLCSGSVVAIGSQSAPPKLSLLQGVPTFIIGHERKRAESENWSGTPMGWFQCDGGHYSDLCVPVCLQNTMQFVAENAVL